MKLLIQLACSACQVNFTVELRELGDGGRLQCPGCGKAFACGPDQTWRLLRSLREEIRKVAEGGYGLGQDFRLQAVQRKLSV